MRRSLSVPCLLLALLLPPASPGEPPALATPADEGPSARTRKEVLRRHLTLEEHWEETVAALDRRRAAAVRTGEPVLDVAIEGLGDLPLALVDAIARARADGWSGEEPWLALAERRVRKALAEAELRGLWTCFRPGDPPFSRWWALNKIRARAVAWITNAEKGWIAEARNGNFLLRERLEKERRALEGPPADPQSHPAFARLEEELERIGGVIERLAEEHSEGGSERGAPSRALPGR